MTKEDFIKGIREGAVDIDDPASDYTTTINELTTIRDEISPFDVALAAKLGHVLTSIKDLGAFIKLRAADLPAED